MDKSKIPLKILNEWKVLLVFIENPNIRYYDAVKRACLPERTFANALKRLRLKKVLQKNNRHYSVDKTEFLAFFSDLWKRLYPSRRKLTRMEKEVERHSVNLEELFKKAKFENYEEFKKWFILIDNLKEIFSSETGYLKVDEKTRRHAEIQETTGVSLLRKMRAIKTYPDLQKIFEVNKRILRHIERESWKKSFEASLAEGSKMPSYGKRIVREYCSTCHSDVDAVFDYDSGEIVCIKCGTVIADVLIEKWSHEMGR